MQSSIPRKRDCPLSDGYSDVTGFRFSPKADIETSLDTRYGLAEC